jgi:hypothetical protein
VIFERLDWRPYGIRPALPIAATPPAGEPTRLDRFRAVVAAELLPKLGTVEDDHELAEALDRWELSLFQGEPFRSEQLRASLTAALGGEDGLWAASVRAAALLGEDARDRADLFSRLRKLAFATAGDVIRRALVELLLQGERRTVIANLDETLLGLREPPRRATALRAKAS